MRAGPAGGSDPARAAALVAQLDATQEAIERANAALFNAHGALLVRTKPRLQSTSTTVCSCWR